MAAAPAWSCASTCVVQCLESLPVRGHRVLLTPRGARLTQRRVGQLAELDAITLICGRYEGIDARIADYVDEELSLGDFVLSGGELAAMCVIDAVARFIPGVLGNPRSLSEESHSPDTGGMLEYPHYTRPGRVSRRTRARGALERQPRGHRSVASRAARGAEAMRRVGLSLLHHPVLGRQGQELTTTLTNLDLHDISRCVRAYGLYAFYAVHPYESQRILAERIRSHWTAGAGGKRIPDRASALEVLRIVPDIAAACDDLGEGTELWTTAAVAQGEVISYATAREQLEHSGAPVMLCFGTGWGLSPGFLQGAQQRIEPIKARRDTGYNHLSVRGAVAITLDRLLG